MESTLPHGSRNISRNSSTRRFPVGAPTINTFARSTVSTRPASPPPTIRANFVCSAPSPSAPVTTSTPTSSPWDLLAASPPTSAPACSYTTRPASSPSLKRSAACKFFTLAKPIPPTPLARASFATSSPPPPSSTLPPSRSSTSRTTTGSSELSLPRASTSGSTPPAAPTRHPAPLE